VTEWIDLPVLDGFYVYALYGASNDRTPLYVGQSKRIFGRLSFHLGDAAKRGEIARIAIRRCSSEVDMDQTEQQLIAKYCPPWNSARLPAEEVARRRGGGVPAEATEAARAKAVERAERERQLSSILLTVDEVAERLDCSLADLKRWTLAGSLRSLPHKTFKYRRFHWSWVEEFEQRQVPA